MESLRICPLASNAAIRSNHNATLSALFTPIVSLLGIPARECVMPWVDWKVSRPDAYDCHERDAVEVLQDLFDWADDVDLAYAWVSTAEGTAAHWKAMVRSGYAPGSAR